MIIALSGPAGAGKGTLAKMLAEVLGLPHYDFGLIFRAVVFVGYDLASLRIEHGRILFNDQDITESLRSEEIGLMAAKSPACLKHMAMSLVRHTELICDGRTCGTEIYPDADFKFYITASLSERLKRRDNNPVLLKREMLDSKKDVIPEGSIIIDTTGKTREESLEKILSFISGS